MAETKTMLAVIESLMAICSLILRRFRRAGSWPYW
jgi:hypothetical protein